MNSTDFLIEQLNSLVIRFPFIKYRYEYNDLSYTHLVELFLHENAKQEVIKKSKTSLLRMFRRQFPLEGLLFVSPDTLSQIRNASYEKSGLFFWELEAFGVATVSDGSERLMNDTSSNNMMFEMSTSIGSVLGWTTQLSPAFANVEDAGEYGYAMAA